MFLVAELKTDQGQLVTVLTVAPKEFKTGSKGYYANAKTEIDGKRYQIQVQIVEIGSKNKSEDR
ncbi:MAG TPA: hypothetical protein PKM21_03145 [Anaerolineales bacterium]|nr:hypothetical protein [Anaerolineales bacterium]